MSWSYSGEPSSSVKDAVRFNLQDTDESAPLLEDAEILYAIAKEAPGATPTMGEVLSATALCMEALERRFSMAADVKEGALEIKSSARAKVYREAAAKLRLRAAGMHAPFSGGMSESEKQARAEATNEVPPLFRRLEFAISFSGPDIAPFPAEAVTESER